MQIFQDFQQILFLDIETVSGKKSYSELSDKMQLLWNRKAQTLAPVKDLPPAEAYTERAAIYAEFGKIICISCGYLIWQDGEPGFRVKSFYDIDEKSILLSFSEMIQKKAGWRLCAHNGKEFDYPYLCRRLLINGISIPDILSIQGKKPWEISNLDTLELWKFGDYKAFTSLDLLAAVFDHPTPKEDISGADVGRVFWQENDLERIRKYCEKDVFTTAQILLKMGGLNPVAQDKITYIEG